MQEVWWSTAQWVVAVVAAAVDVVVNWSAVPAGRKKYWSSLKYPLCRTWEVTVRFLLFLQGVSLEESLLVSTATGTESIVVKRVTDDS